MAIQCPYCHSQVEVDRDSQWTAMTCPSCGETFRLVDLETQSAGPESRETLGHFELLQIVGVGGFGAVWKARDRELDRIVAVKVPRESPINPVDTQRFLREARAAAQLRHPNIVRVHEVGHSNDKVFIVSDFVDGVSLAEWLTAKHPTPRESAELCIQIATALQHAHESGVVHRDLKPSNILMDRSGQPHIMDFGLAKREVGEVTMTVEGKLLGTPAYMSPEQAKGEGHRADCRADVYSLGVILFELLTGQRPFQGSVRMLLHQVLYEDAPSLRSLNRRISRDLETICHKCLHKDPDHRYQTAQELAQDLRRFAAGEAILARPEPVLTRLWRRTRRHKTALIAAALVGLAVVLSGFLSQSYFAHKTRVINGRALEISGHLASPQMTEAFLVQGEALIARLAELAPERAGQYRAELSRSYAQAIQDKLREPYLTPEKLAPLESALSRLATLDPTAEQTLRRTLQDRLTRPESAFRLTAPFANLSAVFDPAIVNSLSVDAGTLGRGPNKGEEPSGVFETQHSSGGTVEFKARFQSPSWKSASRIGLILGAGSKNEYAIVLRTDPSAGTSAAMDRQGSFARAHESGQEAIIQIERNGRVLRARRLAARLLTQDTLELVVARRGEELSLTIPGLESLKFVDVFSPGTFGGVFAVDWPEGVRLTSLEATRQSLPAVPSPLEKGDALFNQGESHYATALDFYREQSLLDPISEVGQESRYKEALCRIKLGQTNEATAVLEPLATEPGSRWPILARCQLWLLYLRQNKLKLADEMLDSLILTGAASAGGLLEGTPATSPFEPLASLVPDEVFQELLQANIQRYSGFNAVRFDPEHVRRLERLAVVSDQLNFEPKDRLITKLVLIYAYRMVGNPRRALQKVEEILESSDVALSPVDHQSALIHSLCWLQRELGDSAAAARSIERFLFLEPGVYRTEFRFLLLERARIHATQGKLDDADHDLDEYLRLSQAERLVYPEFARVWLLRGFLHKQRGDNSAAMEAWRQGLFKNYAAQRQIEPADSLRLIPWDSVLHGVVLGSLTGEFNSEDRDQLIELLVPLFGGASREVIPVLQPFNASVLRRAFQTPQGLDFARRLAFLDMSIPEYLKLPIQLTMIEAMRVDAFGRELTVEEHEILWRLSDDAYSTYFKGDLNGDELMVHLATIMGIWTDTFGWPIGWHTIAPKLSPGLRSGFAYVFAMRFLRTKKPPVAVTFLRTALADSAPDSVLHKHAQIHLERATAKPSDPPSNP